jgi:DNA-binding NarL/FixJ family response regulator
MKLRLVVADGHWLIREGLQKVLERTPRNQVVGKAAHQEELLTMAVELTPQVVICDLQLPGEGGIAILRQLKTRCPMVKVVMLADGGGVTAVREALREGCVAYLRKDAGQPDLLLEALDKVRQGQIFLDAEVTRELVLQDYRRDNPPDQGPLTRLSQRERTVFQLIGAGYTNRAAAERIELSPKTVEKHRAAVMQKLNLSSAFELRVLAQRLGEAQAVFKDS